MLFIVRTQQGMFPLMSLLADFVFCLLLGLLVFLLSKQICFDLLDSAYCYTDKASHLCFAARMLRTTSKHILGKYVISLHMHFITLFYSSNDLTCFHILLFFFFPTSSNIYYVSPNIVLNYFGVKSGHKQVYKISQQSNIITNDISQFQLVNLNLWIYFLNTINCAINICMKFCSIFAS